MSGIASDEDFGSFATPAAPKRIATVARTTNKPNSRNVSGPSSKPASGATAAGKRKNAKRQRSEEAPEIEEVEHVNVTSGEDEPDQVEPPAPKAKARQVPVRGASAVNGKGKGKGKDKIGPPKSARKVEPVQAIEIIDETEEGDAEGDANLREAAEEIDAIAATPLVVKKPRRPPNSASNTKELERLRRKVTDYEAQLASMTAQLNESLAIRTTEPEMLLERQHVVYEARIEALQATVKELTSQLARVEPLSRTGTSSVLYLLTREAADEEKRDLVNELANWKDVVKEKDAVIADKNKRIAELEQIERDTRYELNIEIERSKTLNANKNTSRNPPSSASRSRAPAILGNNDPKTAEVIKFYEDLTNLLVTSMKSQPAPFPELNLDEWTMVCVYTYVNMEDATKDQHSLNFTLRLCYDASDKEKAQPEDESHLNQTVHYIPMELDKESPDFVEKLAFLNAPFTFGRDQLPLFLSSLYRNMSESSEDESNSADTSVQQEQEDRDASMEDSIVYV